MYLEFWGVKQQSIRQRVRVMYRAQRTAKLPHLSLKNKNIYKTFSQYYIFENESLFKINLIV